MGVLVSGHFLFRPGCPPPLFGERSHLDRNLDAAAALVVPPSGQFVNPMGGAGWWANSGGWRPAT